MKQETLVSFYGDKPESLIGLIGELNRMIQIHLPGNGYEPYPIDQVHATLIGLEKTQVEGSTLNRNRWEREGIREVMDLSQIPGLLKKHFPMPVRIGGFHPVEQPFLSREHTPYERTFWIDRKNKRVVLMGWPHCKSDFSGQLLFRFREAMRKICHAAHKYDRDNDLYMVLGIIDPDKHEPINKLENEVRDYLSHRSIDIIIDTVQKVAYTDERLPSGDTDLQRIYHLH